MWQDHDIGSGLLVEVGDARWHFRTQGEDLLWQLERDNRSQLTATATTDSDELDTSGWQRWLPGTPPTRLWLNPAMPDKPVVVRPGQPLHLAPQCTIQVYVELPLWLQVFTDATANAPVLDQPCTQLSKTWFGPSPTEGTLCYQLRSEAGREAPSLAENWRACCPLTISNRAKQTLPLQRLCIRCQCLSCWQGSNGLWTNEITATITEEAGDPAELHIGKGAATLCQQPSLLAGPRQTAGALRHLPLFASGKVWR